MLDGICLVKDSQGILVGGDHLNTIGSRLFATARVGGSIAATAGIAAEESLCNIGSHLSLGQFA